MKKFFLYFVFCLYFANCFSSGVDDFIAEYTVKDYWTLTAGGMTGYKDTSYYSTNLVYYSTDTVLILNFSGLDSVFAIIKLDSIIIPSQTFYYNELEYNKVSGRGKLSGHILKIHYRIGGPIGNIESNFIGIKKSASQLLVTTGKKWTYAEGQDFPDFKIFRYSVLEIGADTSLSNVRYKKLIEYPDRSFSETRLKGLIRETDERKVYYRKANEKDELLLYDFGIAPKDSFYCEYVNKWMVMDSIEIDEINRSNFYLHTKNNGPIRWIDGVGSIDGLLMENSVGGFKLFTCCRLDTEILFQAENAIGCDYFTSVKMLKVQEMIKVISTGYNSEIKILNDGLMGKLQLYNMEGRLLLKSKISQPETTFCLPETGLLLYRYESSSGEVQTGKVMVK